MKTVKIKLENKKVYFSQKLPSHRRILKALEVQKKGIKAIKPSVNGATLLVICDRKLRSFSEVGSWLKKYSVYFVSAGEELKNLDSFSRHVSNILKKAKKGKILGFISLGGGSVGDFTGFLASVYNRGVPLVHIPSTWLSSMDSAHGGKTALNVKNIKNVIGSYYFPQAVFIVRSLLFSLSKKEKESAKGELIKIALIEGGSFYSNLMKKKTLSNLDLWSFLPQAVLAKLKITQGDPYEKKGQRRALNFGHTIGHVLESYFRIPHGEAVLYGVIFAVQWSHNRFVLSSVFFKELFFFRRIQVQLISYLRKIPKEMLIQLLLHDKKRIGKNHINFIFIKSPGRVFVEPILIRDLMKEIQNQIAMVLNN